MTTEEEIIKIAVAAASENTLDIIKWAVGIATPVVLTMATAIGVLWKSGRNKDKEIQRLNALLTQQALDQTKKYYEALKELAPFVERSVDVQNKIYELTEELLSNLSGVESKYTSISDDLQDLPKLLLEIKQEVASRLQSSHDDSLVLKTRLENLLAAIEAKLNG